METVSITALAKLVGLIIRYLPNISKAFSFVFPKEINGVWCICWKNANDDPCYQLGTMEIQQLVNVASGHFYSRDQKWPFISKVENNEIIGFYKADKKTKGSFKLQVKDFSREVGVITGKWSGEVYDPKPDHWETMDTYGMDFFAARGKAHNPYCHLKEFKDTEGHCTQKINV